MRNQKNLGNFSKEVIAYGLLGFCFFTAGCGGPSKESVERKEEAKRQATENKLKAVLHPAMAKVGKRAVMFARENPDEFTWYKDYDDQWKFSISDEADQHKVDLSLRKGVSRSSIAPGDVEYIYIKNEEHKTNAYIPSYDVISEIRIETEDTIDAPCGKGLQASAGYTYISQDTGEESAAFITADRCQGDSVKLGLSETASSTLAAKVIVDYTNRELNDAFSFIK